MGFSTRRFAPSRCTNALAVGLAAAATAFAARAATGDAPSGDGGAPAAPGAAHDAATIRYDRDVRPLLSDRCFKCHGRDESKRKAKLRLDDATNAGEAHARGTPIVPGDPDASELLERIASDDPKRLMPPPGSNKRPFHPEEQALLRRWIEQGAKYEEHWAFVAPRRPPLPEVKEAAWCATPVDRFIVANLEREGVAPGPEAPPETQLRRLFLDLTGLPPTPEELDAFLADARPDAWERAVDRIFSEEPYRSRYAERMATPWLDAARYADTCGIHTDAGRQIWPWRDWVLHAFRDHLPFDRFVVEQLAGDLLPGATEAQKVASGFQRNHVTTDEGGAIAEEYLVEYAVDRTATLGSVFLALTLGCARCHEHKYDPISHEDFFRVYAFFDSIEEPGLYSQLPDPNRAFEPSMKVPSPALSKEIATAKEELERAKAELESTTPEERALEAKFLADLPADVGLAWAPTRLVSASARSGASATPQQDGSVLFGGENPARDDHDLVLRTEASRLRVLALEALEDPSLPMGRVGRAPNGNAVLSGVEVEAVSVADPARRETVLFAWAWADHEQPDGDHRVVNLLENGDALGWAVDAHRVQGERVALLLAEKPFGFEGGTELHVTLQYYSVYAQHTFGRVRVTVGDLGDRGRERLAVAKSGWYVTGPFLADSGKNAYDQPFGPESDGTLDLAKNFGGGNQAWRFDAAFKDAQVNPLADGVNASYVARRIFSPTARKVEVALGSDDGFRLFLNGKEVASNRIDRAAAPNQDKATLDLVAGTNVVVFKIVNTGGDAGFYWRALDRADELAGDLTAALLPAGARSPALAKRLHEGWRSSFSPEHRLRRERVAGLETRLAELDKKTPQTMVMQELATPRQTFVLKRGEYDKPDQKRPVERAIPTALSKLPDGAPKNRLGLAQWLVAPENPLVARVAVNRWWEMLFGTGLVRSNEDFGLQSEWPSHPELLDWLAVALRERARRLDELLVVPEDERLQRRVGRGAADRARFARRRVERL